MFIAISYTKKGYTLFDKVFAKNVQNDIEMAIICVWDAFFIKLGP